MPQSYLPWIFVALVALAFAVSAIRFWALQEYAYLVEQECDPGTHLCFARSCDEGECPPNELSFYRMFSIPAESFKECADNSCINLCTGELDSPCEEILCLPGEETCTAPPVAPEE